MFFSISDGELEISRDGIDHIKYNKYLKLGENVNDVKGYYPYIKELKEKVFMFKHLDINVASDIFERMNPHSHTMVSIHIRMRDYKDHLENLYNISIYTPSIYLTMAMDYFVKKYDVGKKCRVTINVV